jgi:uncharacterized protein (TIGR02145 family)
MKKQCKRFPSWGYKGLLSVALSSLVVVTHAQGVEVCEGTAYAITSTVDASGASTYQWLENGQIISGASAATYMVPSDKVEGLYTYIRQAKSADCSEWQSSNEFAVTVFNCSFTAGTQTSATATFIDPRDGKRYKTVVMPDGKTWFAQNLNYTKDLTYNAYSYEANGVSYVPTSNGVPAIGSYWCPPVRGGVAASGDESACNTYGALYTWETVMMVDGKYADEAKTSSAWDESWVSGNYFATGAPGSTPQAKINNARGGRGICPMGWHIPTDYEWANLLDKVEGNTTYTVNQTGNSWWGTNAGKKLKSAATYTGNDPGNGSWWEHANRGTDNYGFSALPAGYRIYTGSTFDTRGVNAGYWSSSCYASNGWYRLFNYSSVQVNRIDGARSTAITVRCKKD